MRNTWKSMKWPASLLGAALLAAQLVPVDRTNSAVEAEVGAPPGVHAVLRRACYDCHSNETTWPWYSRIAPVSWLVASDVQEGREAINFSRWNRLAEEKQRKAVHEIWEEVSEGEMPPWIYVPLHPEARLSDADRALLRAWAASSGRAEADED